MSQADKDAVARARAAVEAASADCERALDRLAEATGQLITLTAGSRPAANVVPFAARRPMVARSPFPPPPEAGRFPRTDGSD